MRAADIVMVLQALEGLLQDLIRAVLGIFHWLATL